MKLVVAVQEGRNLIAKNANGRSDSFVEVIPLNSQGDKVGKAHHTKVVKANLNPRWNDVLNFDSDGSVTGLNLRVWDKHRFRADKFMGTVTIKFNNERLAASRIDEWFALKKRTAKEPVSGEVRLTISIEGSPGAAAPNSGTSASSLPDNVSATDLKVSASYDTKGTNDALESSTHVVVDEDDVDDFELLDDSLAYTGSGGKIDDYSRLRAGPPAAALERLVKDDKSASIGSKGLDVTNTGSTPGESWTRCNVSISGLGRWQFEARVVTAGQAQIGWATSNFSPRDKAGSSWCYDGSRQQKIKNVDQPERFGEYWSSGDVLTCVLDLPKRTVSYWRNGTPLGQAYGDILTNISLMPVISVGRRTKIAVNFGKENFAFAQPDCYSLHSALSNKDLAELAGIFDILKHRSNQAMVLEAEAEDEASIKAESTDLSEQELVKRAGELGLELKDVIYGDGMAKLQEELTGKQEEDDPVLLLVAFHLQCEHFGEIDKEEWMNGWHLAGCSKMSQMRKKVRQWRSELSDDNSFRAFYNFVFDYLKEDPAKKFLGLDEATLLWTLVLGGTGRPWALLDKFLAFLEADEKKAIGRDAWQQIYHLMKTHPSSMDGYDDAGSWPTLYDEFAEWWMKEKEATSSRSKPVGVGNTDSSTSSSSDSD